MPYLDYNATTPVDPEVLEAMLPWLGPRFGNPSSDYPLGRSARQALDESRDRILRCLGARSGRIIFTGCGTEANNLALLGTFLPRLNLPDGKHSESDRGGHLIIGAIEHPATARCAAHLASLGFSVTEIGVDGHGLVDPDAIERAIRPDTRLVSIMHANNEVGSIQPLSDIAKRLKGKGILFHTDAAQTLGKIPVDVETLGVDLLSLTGHKFYAPKGIGALWVREGVVLSPILWGGGQEQGLRSGTENVAFAVGMATALQKVHLRVAVSQTHLKSLRERLWEGLVARLGERVRRTGDPARTLPNTLHVCLRNLKGHDILHGIPEVQASTGSACHAGIDRPSSVLVAMGYPKEWSLGAIRMSLGWATTAEEVDDAAERMAETVLKLAAAPSV